MAFDKVVDSALLDGKLTAVAEAIRSKTGEDGLLTLEDMPEQIAVLDKAITLTVSGDSIAIADSAAAHLRGLKLFGKTTQSGTPTPENPVPLVNAGDYGGITITVGGGAVDQTMTYATPSGLPGIPVTSGGNYIDDNGQQWICDEVDFARGVYVQRVDTYAFDGTETVTTNNVSNWRPTTAQFTLALNNVTNIGITDSKLSLLITHGGTGYPLECVNGVCVRELSNYRVYFGGERSVVGETPESVQAWLTAQNEAGTPLKIMYTINTPIETVLTESEVAGYAVLRTSYPNTTIINDAKVGMEAAYSADSALLQMRLSELLEKAAAYDILAG